MGHAKDYVELQWRMLQQDQPSDYVISTGCETSVRQFVQWSLSVFGVEISWAGSGDNEVGVVEGVGSTNLKKGQIIIRVSKLYYRPAEVDQLMGDSSKARTELDWKPKYNAKELCIEMTLADARLALTSEKYKEIIEE